MMMHVFKAGGTKHDPLTLREKFRYDLFLTRIQRVFTSNLGVVFANGTCNGTMFFFCRSFAYLYA